MTNERDDRLPWVKMILRMEAEYEADLLSRAVETMKDMDTQRPLKPMIFVSTPNGWKQILEISERCEGGGR